METSRVRCAGLRRIILLASPLAVTACASVPLPFARSEPAPPPPAAARFLQSEEDDWSQMTAQLRTDLNRYNGRQIEHTAASTPVAHSTKERNHEFASRAQALFEPLNGVTLRMPVVGVQPEDLDDSWHAPRDGGVRVHKGIDIFAIKGTEVVAVAEGVVSYIGEQPKGGRCLWLTTENGASFYYAHLDRWAPGLYEGMAVQSGDLLGYVGNTGNAIHTPSHLHFAVNENDEMVNPFPLLSKAALTARAHVHAQLGGGIVGTR